MYASVDERKLDRRLCDAFEQSTLLGAYAVREEIHYVLLEARGPILLGQRLEKRRPARAFSGRFPMLSWDEREMACTRGVAFDELPDPRPLFITRYVDPAAVVARGEGLMQVVVGPVHAGVNEPGRFTFSSGGETVVHLDARLSFTHRGVERRLEGMRAQQAARYVARICGSCSAARSFAYARALERGADIALSRDVELARVAIAELERLYNHVSDLAGSASAASFGPGSATGLALKEELMRLNGRASGHRLLFDAIVPGGVSAFVAENLLSIAGDLTRVRSRVERYLDSLFRNASLVSRWHRTGVVSRAMAKAFGAVGPALRASNGGGDVRTSAPYGAYEFLAPRVAAAAAGDVFARCAVKRDEIAESFRLIEDAFAQLRGRVAPPLEIAVGAGTSVAVVEGPRGAEVAALHVDPGGVLERAHFISASYRNWPIVAEAMNGNIIPDFPLVNHSFSLCYACADR
jgi:Ni,Fe-hydrogenase III large subunit